MGATGKNLFFFLKNQNTESKLVEVSTATPDSRYESYGTRQTTEVNPWDSTNGTWAVEDGDIYFIKTKNAGTSTIEIHRLPQSNNYQKYDIQTPTGFSSADADNGIWTISNGDLYFIKTKNTAGTIEVYKANHEASGWPIDAQFTTVLIPGSAENGTLTYRNGKLYLIKTRDTETGKVEVIIVDGNKSDHLTRYESFFSVTDDKNGFWEVSEKGDLYFVKTANTGSGKIELHIALANSETQDPYQEVWHYATVFDEGDANNGLWIV